QQPRTGMLVLVGPARRQPAASGAGGPALPEGPPPPGTSSSRHRPRAAPYHGDTPRVTRVRARCTRGSRTRMNEDDPALRSLTYARAAVPRPLPGLQAKLLAPGAVEVGRGGAARPGRFVVLGGEVAGAGAGKEGLTAHAGVGGVLLAVGRGRDVHDVAPALLAADFAHS